MNSARVLFELKCCQLKGRLQSFREHSYLKIFVVTTFGLLFWAGLFWMFYLGFEFIRDRVPDQAAIIHHFLFGLFFLSLFVLLTLSNGLISYASLFRARETAFLLTGPIPTESVFAYKFFESLSFSSWAVLFLGGPFLVAYGLGEMASVSFYLTLILLFLPFVMIPGALGVLGALLLSSVLTRYRRGLLRISMVLLPIVLVVGVSKMLEGNRQADLFDSIWVQQVFQKLTFVHHPLLPSYWMNQGVVSAREQRWVDVAFWGLLLLANALFVFQVGFLIARGYYRTLWSSIHSIGGSRRVRAGLRIDRLLEIGFGYLRRQTRLFLAKDIRIFLRDPIQLGQFLVLVGLLWLYIINLRALSYDGQRLSWRVLIAFLNLGATSLTLTTLSSRFVFPMLSLEGQRFWVLGVVPVSRDSILAGKFAFSLIGLSVVSVGLAFGSSAMLRLPWSLTGIQCFVMLLVSVGISGLSVGLGALYPDFHEDDPSKIVAGFGGTLNLILSLGFIVMAIGGTSIGVHLLLLGTGGRSLTWNPWCLIPFVAVIFLSVATCFFPLRMGRKHFSCLEL
ncbi:MAG: hypothetical protein QF752_11195 [Planctomycetota bacterium]|nr:hypothetical protein [Planctomycetota bacterium]